MNAIQKTALILGIIGAVLYSPFAGHAWAQILSNGIDITHREEFYQNYPEWLSMDMPPGWTTKVTGNPAAPVIIATDNWGEYGNGLRSGTAIGLLPDRGSAPLILNTVLGRLDGMVYERLTAISTETLTGQSYASIEFLGPLPSVGEEQSHYFLTTISIERRSIVVLTRIGDGKAEETRPRHYRIVDGITLH